ncbi:ATP-dependent DNA helicase PIF1 [Hirsutella rhossiliensis]|uniref:ATP-dependent DNA helicase PIF1 n=1 Tax=Hirsutella rhossiliensis TaxID=111463 RepID=A0A9P8MXI1_9HYPO|nr:ATP-dependent DNA helicase PIF1 [Hirsutella rhossiliensis]KAH0962096.1 ATP-dependent DNA helicase PIF1 [Hirsutella rhossiliensis]
MVCLDGYLSKDFDEDDEGSCYRRAAVQHLALFLLRRSAEDAKRDAKQWAASSGDGDSTAVYLDEDGTAEAGVEPGSKLDRGEPNHGRLARAHRMMQELSRFQQLAFSSSSEFQAAILSERGPRRINIPGRASSGATIPPQSQVRAIKSQQTCASREREKMIRGIQSVPPAEVTDRRAAVRSVLTGFGDDDILMTAADLEETVEASAGMEIRLGASTSFIEAGKALVARFTLNKKQEKGNGCQLCQFVGGEGGTGKSRVIEALVELFASKDQSNRDLDGLRMPNQAERFVHGQSRMDWQEKDVLVVDEVSMLVPPGPRAVDPPPSTAVSWDMDNSFKAEQRHQHDKAHALWKRFTTVVMLDEQVRAAGDPELQRLLKRIRLGAQDRTDLDLLNSRCYQEGRRIPWASGITVVTPLNRNRWNLNMEASLAFQIQHRSTLRIFISGHKWKEGLPTEEEAIMMLNQGDDSAIPVPAVFMFVPGMPVVVNHNTHQG